MPFRSEAQRRLLWAKHPEVAQKWAHEYGTPKTLPMHVQHKAVREALLKKMGHR